ncbi:MAG: hypothetical protein R3C14_03905 [Caldilineaceae bacterium]
MWRNWDKLRRRGWARLLYGDGVAIYEDERGVLAALIQGATLKSHRTLDGNKVHRLHPLAGPPVVVVARTVRRLERTGMIRSNMKFPAATYLLTDQAIDLMADCEPQISSPLSAHNHRALL